MNTRRETREFLLQFLFHYQLPAFENDRARASEIEAVDLFNKILLLKETLGLQFSENEQVWVMQMIKGILREATHLENNIQPYLKNWKLNRISKVEHTVLLIAVYELLYEKSLSNALIINEALELTKKYSTKESPQFINGLLDKMCKDLKR